MPDSVWIVTGAAGQVGSHVVRMLLNAEPQGCSGSVVVVAVLRRGGERLALTAPASGAPTTLVEFECDLDSEEGVAELLAAPFFEATTPLSTVVIHCAGMTAIGACLADPVRAQHLNAGVVRQLAAGLRGASLVACSTDMVFNGAPRGADGFTTSDAAEPLSIYGKTKLAGEQAALAAPAPRDGGAGAVVVARLPLMYGVALSTRYSKSTFASQIVSFGAAESSGGVVRAFDDEWRTPMSYSAAAAGLVVLGRAAMERAASSGLDVSSTRALVHLAGPDRLSRLQMVHLMKEAWVARLREACRNDTDAILNAIGHQKLGDIEAVRVEGNSRLSIASPEPRPADLSMVPTAELWGCLIPVAPAMSADLPAAIADYVAAILHRK